MKRILAIVYICYLLIGGQEVDGQNSGSSFKSFTDDGAWCWFSDPRAVSLNGTIYSGWVAADGSVMVASYNEKTEEITEVNMHPKFNKDDHANPSLLILPDNLNAVVGTASVDVCPGNAGIADGIKLDSNILAYCHRWNKIIGFGKLQGRIKYVKT